MYEELTVDDSDLKAPPIDAAIDKGWATVVSPLEFSEPVVSRVMDGVQRYIANADDRPADEVERADAALAALAAQSQGGDGDRGVHLHDGYRGRGRGRNCTRE